STGVSVPSSRFMPAASGESAIAHERTSTQRRADALGLLAESALAADFDRGTAGDRFQVVLHVEAGVARSVVPPIVHDPEFNATAVDGARAATDIGQAVLELGSGGMYVSAETSERIACDASVVVMSHGPDGSVLDVGRKTRTIPPAIRRALAARDTLCQFPGC